MRLAQALLQVSSEEAYFHRNSWRPSWDAQAGWPASGELACQILGLDIFYKGHKWQTGSLWVAFTDMFSLVTEVFCKYLGLYIEVGSLRLLFLLKDPVIGPCGAPPPEWKQFSLVVCGCTCYLRQEADDFKSQCLEHTGILNISYNHSCGVWGVSLANTNP